MANKALRGPPEAREPAAIHPHPESLDSLSCAGPWPEVEPGDVLLAAMHSAAVGMALVSPDGRFLEANRALADLLGRTPANLFSMTWQELTHRDDVDADLGLVDDVLAGRRDSYRIVKRFVRPDGTLVWGDVNVGCVRDLSGHVQFLVKQIVDVTESAVTREALTLSVRRWREALDAFDEPS